METNNIYHGDCFELLPTLPDGCIDAVITDPPYGIKLDTWDNPIDIPTFTRQIKRVLKPNGFYAFFGQMPTLLNWCNYAQEAGFSWLEHITWVKRAVTPTGRLSRTKEEIMVYGLKNKTFWKKDDLYADVVLPKIYTGIGSLEGLEVYIRDLHDKIKKPNHSSTVLSTARMKIFDTKYGFESDRSPEFANYTNVWSFLPPNNTTRDGKEDTEKHPTRKPVPVVERLIEMLTEQPTPDAVPLVLDPFLGSGTTAIAAINTGRHYIGIERNAGYFQLATSEITAVRQQPKLFI
jgi:DNA modification methylase